MDQFYRDTFESFTAKWTQSKPNIMEFNQFLDDIYGVDFKKNLPSLLDKSYATKATPFTSS